MKIIIILLLIAAQAITSISYAQKEIDVDLDKSIALSMNYLKDNTLADGRFVYRRYANSEIDYKNKQYNVLRHAGTLYSMYLCERVLKDSSLREERLRASAYLIENYMQAIDNERYAVISKGVEEGASNDSMAKLGGAGLSLIALSNLYPEGKVDIKLLHGLGHFILFMQQANGGFSSKYSLATQSIGAEFNSLYYPGEAALGLLYLYEFDPQPKWLDAAKKALFYLANKRQKQDSNVEFDHWALLATQKLLETPGNELRLDEKILLQKHAEQMANSVLPKQIQEQSNPYYGAFHENIRPCSIGTIMEGLVAVYCVTENEELKNKVSDALKTGVNFLIRSQIKEGKTSGGLPTRADWQSPNSNTKASVIQIDNVQHVLSAWITYKNHY